MLNSKWIEFSPFNCHCFMETHFKHGKIKKKKTEKNLLHRSLHYT